MPGFRIFQPSELVALGDELLGRSGAYYHTGGSLYDGKIIWLLAKFDKAIHVRGDGSPIEDYLALINGFDGRHGCTALTGMVRIVCGNTCAQAIAGARDKVTLRHTPGMENRVGQIRAVLDVHVQYRETLEAVLNRLTEKPMTIDEVKQFTTVLVPDPVDPDAAVKKHPRLQLSRDLITALFAQSPTLEGVPFTAYRAYQAVTEYADNYRRYGDTKLKRGSDLRATSVIEGPAYDLKTDAVRILLKA
jgi:phage/plasmid-like protein (TIGR03299 family)